MTAEQHEQLDWLAFKYIAGELSDAEAEAFELRLAEDEAAQDAVASAVQLTAAVIEAEQATEQEARTATAAPSSYRPLFRKLGLIAAAAAIVATATFLLLPPPNTPSPITAMTQLETGWQITPIGNAVSHINRSGHLVLDRGELHVVSTREDAQPLQIKTPEGTAEAFGTEFLIGTHSPTSTETKTMKRFTRILVLAGVVTLTNPLGSITGHEHDLIAAEKDAEPVKVTVAANSAFAVDLFRRIAKQHAGENVFLSPYSISNALAMVTEGARGKTAQQMGTALHFPDAARRVGDDAQLIPWRTSLIHTGMAALNRKLNGGNDLSDPKVKAAVDKLKKLRGQLALIQLRLNISYSADAHNKANRIVDQINELSTEVNQYELKVANALWGEQTYPFNKAYVETINKHYDTGGLFPVDFKNNYPAARKQINAWAAEMTNNRIPNVMPDMTQAEARDLRLVLTNAIYFKGEWEEPFEKDRTKPRDFTLADGNKIKAPTMHAHALWITSYGAFNADGSLFKTPVKYNPDKPPAFYPGADGFSMIEMPYKGQDLVMIILTPNDPAALPALEKKLTAPKLNTWIKQLKHRDTHVYLPKFKQEATYDLVPALKAMGMTDAFSREADFTGINDSNELFISSITHKTFVEVNEIGTEAAAVTIATLDEKGKDVKREIKFTPTFRADRPFLYLIREQSTGSILFLGRVTNPTK